MKSTFAAKLVALAFGASLALMNPAAAQTVEEFYKGKNVTLVVSAAPGGAADFFARAFAEYFGKHMPGQPSVVVMNLPGAGGMVAAAQLQNTEPKDGTVIALLQRNNLYQGLLNGDTTLFDPRQVDWLGSLNKEAYTVVAMADAPAKTTDDIFKNEIILGATGFSNENRTLPEMMNRYFGTKFKIITGYEGNDEIALAMERGEVHGRLYTVNSLFSGTDAKWMQEGKINVLVQVGMKANPLLPDVPAIVDFTEDPDALALAKFMFLPLDAGRPFAVPKGVPEDRLAAIKTAFADAAADPDFIAHMKSLDSALDPITGEDINGIIDTLYNTPEGVLNEARALLKAE